MHRRLSLSIILLLGVGVPSASAGMPSFSLSDVAQARIEVISFFLVLYLLLGWAVKGLWNFLARGWEGLPRIGYRQGLALMLISGLFLYVVLTMISGARELMTPGAWRKEGTTYKIASKANEIASNARRHQLGKLKEALWNHAASHEGKLPDSIFGGIPDDTWRLPGGEGWYCYLGGQLVGSGRSVIAYEPMNVGDSRWVLLADGAIEEWTAKKLYQTLQSRQNP